jgi:hypothetical protein
MQQSLLDRLVGLMKLDNPEEWERLCHHAYATQPRVTCWTRGRRRLRLRDLPTAKDWLDQLANLPTRSPEKAARKCLRSYRRGDPRASTDTLLTDWLCWNCVQRFADVYRNQMVGRIKGNLERKPLDPALITAETLRFDPDELVLDGGEFIIVDVRVEPAPGEPKRRRHWQRDVIGAAIKEKWGPGWPPDTLSTPEALRQLDSELDRLKIIVSPDTKKRAMGRRD